MTLQEAADKLHDELCPNKKYPSWLQLIAVDEKSQTIWVYTKNNKGFDKISKYEGFKVKYKYLGLVIPHRD